MAALGALSLSRLQGCTAETIAAAHALAGVATAAGGDISIVSGLRSLTQQEQLYAAAQARQRAGLDTLPAAAPGTSLHERGRAFDIRVNVPMTGQTIDGTYRALADAAASLGLRAGYFFKPARDSDRVHFEVPAPAADTRSATSAPAAPAAPPTAPASPSGTMHAVLLVTLAAVLVFFLWWMG